ncbi:hypothetical protein FRC03_001658 [Tulasnella sp. 419]|nr:hypothetical protein FRC03_001658 [Tulasnella sp. 419]
MDDAGEKASEDHRDTSAEFIQSFDSDLSSVGLQLPSNKPHELADSTKEDFQILEQAWDQLASRDLTFGILTDYNKSLILLRHRHSGTLYVSPQINLSSQEINAITFTACLTKLSLWDATARQQQLSASSPTTLPVDEINPPLHHFSTRLNG